MDFNDKLRIARVLRGWSQRDLADRTGIDRSVIARSENQGGGMPRAKTLMTFAKALCVPVDWLMDQKAFFGVYRPISPFNKLLPGPALGRVLDDLQNLVPKFVDEMKINSRKCYVCSLGSVFVGEGIGGVMMICTSDAAMALNTILDCQSLAIDEDLFVHLMIDPATTLRGEKLPQEFRRFSECNDLDLYQVPVETIKIRIEIKNGETVKAEELLKNMFKDDLLSLQVAKTGAFRAHLPDKIQSWLIEKQLSIDDSGRLVKI